MAAPFKYPTTIPPWMSIGGHFVLRHEGAARRKRLSQEGLGARQRSVKDRNNGGTHGNTLLPEPFRRGLPPRTMYTSRCLPAPSYTIWNVTSFSFQLSF